MPLGRTQISRWCQSILAALLAGLLLLLGLVAASEGFHAWLHSEGSAKHANCSACTLAKGQVDSAASFPCLVLSRQVVVWTASVDSGIRSQKVDLSSASSRGPPISVSLL